MRSQQLWLLLTPKPNSREWAALIDIILPVAGYYVENFGCRATQSDGASIEQDLINRGFTRASATNVAQVVVLNSCTVTAAADSDLRAMVRRINRENPNCKILVTGCYAQRAPEEVAALPGVTWVLGNSHKARVAEVAASACRPTPTATDPVMHDCGNFETKHFERAQIAESDSNFISLGDLWSQATGTPPQAALQMVGDIFAHTELMAAPIFETGRNVAKTRPNLKVQDGCDNRCSFCIIPFVRGQSRSLRLDTALEEVGALVAAGYREVVISGINLGRWGRDLSPAARFEDLVRAILGRTELERLRISSVEPMDWSQELIELVANSPRICKHAHVPLQSGSDRVLRMMHRKYRPWHYADRIRRIRQAMPTAAIGADVMVGFPGETDELFEENWKFITELPFTYLHVFTYSSRPGTAAAVMPNHVPVHVARERNKILRDLIAKKNLAFRKSVVGNSIEAITLYSREDGSTEALTNNFLKLRIEGTHPSNLISRIAITGLTQDGLTGVIVN